MTFGSAESRQHEPVEHHAALAAAAQPMAFAGQIVLTTARSVSLSARLAFRRSPSGSPPLSILPTQAEERERRRLPIFGAPANFHQFEQAGFRALEAAPAAKRPVAGIPAPPGVNPAYIHLETFNMGALPKGRVQLPAAPADAPLIYGFRPISLVSMGYRSHHRPAERPTRRRARPPSTARGVGWVCHPPESRARAIAAKTAA